MHASSHHHPIPLFLSLISSQLSDTKFSLDIVLEFNMNIALVILFLSLLAVAINAEKVFRNDLTMKRILSELREIQGQGISFSSPFNTTNDECGVRLWPVSKNLLEWHFSFTGINDSPYGGGIYHGRIRLDAEYPRKAPSILVMTPNGRWEVGKDICLSGVLKIFKLIVALLVLKLFRPPCSQFLSPRNMGSKLELENACNGASRTYVDATS